MASRAICKPRCFHKTELRGWKIPGGKRIASSSLMCINAASHAPVYPTLVSEFWGGAKVEGGQGITGEVLDLTLSCNMITLSEILKAPMEGRRYMCGWDAHFDRADINLTLYGRASITAEEASKVLYLTDDACLVHLLIVNVFCPRISQHTVIRDRDMFIMYHILKKFEIDPVYLVYDHLRQAVGNTSFGIPYGFLITKLLDVKGGDQFVAWSHFDHIHPEVISDKFLDSHHVSTVVHNEVVSEDDEGNGDADLGDMSKSLETDTSSATSGSSSSGPCDVIVLVGSLKRKRAEAEGADEEGADAECPIAEGADAEGADAGGPDAETPTSAV